MSNNRFSPNPDAAGIFAKHDRTAWLKGGRHHCLLPPRTPPNKAWRIILLGAPGTGKNTQAELLCERLGTCHLSTDDVFRAATACGENDLSPAMQNAAEHLQRGETVPDETVLNLVGERLRCLNCAGGFVLDGFPRTVAQAKALEQLLESHDLRLAAVIHYELPAGQIISRISSRRVCANCQAVYDGSIHPPKVAAVCDLCGGKLFQREEDQPELAKARLDAYHHSIRPLIDYYRQRGLLANIAADGSPEEIYQRTRLTALMAG